MRPVVESGEGRSDNVHECRGAVAAVLWLNPQEAAHPIKEVPREEGLRTFKLLPFALAQLCSFLPVQRPSSRLTRPKTSPSPNRPRVRNTWQVHGWDTRRGKLAYLQRMHGPLEI